LSVVDDVEEEPDGLKKESKRFCCMAPLEAWREDGGREKEPIKYA